MILNKDVLPSSAKSGIGKFVPFQQIMASYGFANLGFFQAVEYYNRISIISTCVDLIAESMAQIHPILREKESGEIITDDPITKLLSRPNVNTSWTSFIMQLAAFYLITGNAFIVAKGNVKYAPHSLDVVPPTNVSPLIDGFQVIDYELMTRRYFDDVESGRLYSDTGLSELMHIKRFQPYGIDKTRRFGQSKLASSYYEIDLWEAGRIYNRAILKNGVRPSGILLNNTSFSDEQYESLRAALSSFQGSENAGKVIMLQGLGEQFKFEQLSLSSKDMEFIALTNDCKNSICNRLNVPLPLVNPDASTFNNVENAILFLYDNAVFPLADVLFDEMTRFIVPRYGLDAAKYEIGYDKDEVNAVKTRLINQVITKANSGLFTTNELRAEAGYEDIEGGDFLTRQSSGIISQVSASEYEKYHRILNNGAKNKIIL